MLGTRWLFLLLGLWFGSVSAHAGGSLEDQVRREYQGRVLTLRHFYGGDELHFGSDGRLIGEARVGPWTLDGQLRVMDLHLQNGKLHIEAKRLWLFFDSAGKKLRDANEITPKDPLLETGGQFRKGEGLERLRDEGVLRMDIEMASAPRQMTDIESVLNLVFLSPNDDLADFVPEFWKDFVLQQEGKPPRVAPPGSEPVYKIGEHVSAPRVVDQPDPQYSEEARKIGYLGSAVFALVVTAQGSVRDIRVVTPAGLGLDEMALDAINGWRFDPGHKDGTAVAVQIDISMSWSVD